MFNNSIKLSVLIVVVLTLPVFTSAQNPEGPLQDFEFSPSDSFEESFTGGETVSFSSEFTNPVRKDLPVVVRLRVTGPNMTDTGKEFEVTSSIESDGEELNTTELECSTRKEEGVLIYDCLKDGKREILADSENTVSLDAESSPAIAPGNYEMAFSVLSMIGAPRNSESFNYGEVAGGVTIGNGNERVMIDAEFESEDTPSRTVEVSTMDSIGVEGPQDEYVNGVDVEIGEGIDQEDYTADVRIYYDQAEISGLEESSLTLYRYRPKTGSWTEIGSDINTVQNYLEADLSRFSLYAVYGEEEQQYSDGGSTITIDNEQQEQTDTGRPDGTPMDPVNETKNEEDSEEATEEENEENGEQEGTAEIGDEEGADDEESENVTEESSRGNILTGRFMQSSFNPANLFETLKGFLAAFF